jgi:hypothetical protein
MATRSFLLLDIAMLLAGAGLSLASLRLWGGGRKNRPALLAAMWYVFAITILSAVSVNSAFNSVTGHIFSTHVSAANESSELIVLLLFAIAAVEILALASLIASGSRARVIGTGLVGLWILTVLAAIPALAPGANQCAPQVQECYLPQGVVWSALAFLFAFLSLAVVVVWIIRVIRLSFRAESRPDVGGAILIGTAGGVVSLLARLPLLPVLRGSTSIFSWEGSAVLLLTILLAILAFVWARRASPAAVDSLSRESHECATPSPASSPL